MHFFDTLKQAAGDTAGQEAHRALDNLLARTTTMGGFAGLLGELAHGGLGLAVDAWTQGRDHPPIGPDQIKAALKGDHIQQLAKSLGISTDEVAEHLAQHLPALAHAHAQATG